MVQFVISWLYFYSIHFISLIYKIPKESYQIIKVSLKKTVKKLSKIDQIEIAGKIYKIVFYLGGYLMWLAFCIGLNGANSKLTCPWCVVN